MKTSTLLPKTTGQSKFNTGPGKKQSREPEEDEDSIISDKEELEEEEDFDIPLDDDINDFEEFDVDDDDDDIF